MKTYHRAAAVFADAASQIVDDCKAIAADHSAKGLLKSGATAKRGLASFESRSMEALRQILDEVANRIDHRGRKWRREMAEVEKALEEHIKSTLDLLDHHSFRLAGLSPSSSGHKAAVQLIGGSAQNLRKEFAAFNDGWTSPRSRPWRDRHALLYAVVLLFVGAFVSQIVSWASKQLGTNDQRTAAQFERSVR